MPVFNISINFTTGDSFTPMHVEEELVGVVTRSSEIAKENLRRIKEHYLQYKDAPNVGNPYELTLLTDEHVGERTIQPFWIGYFETLNSAKIVVEDDPEMSFTI